jgi:hypothetical protein
MFGEPVKDTQRFVTAPVVDERYRRPRIGPNELEESPFGKTIGLVVAGNDDVNGMHASRSTEDSR